MGIVYNSNNENVNEAQVSQGFAVAYRSQEGCDSYKKLELIAKSQKLNIWSDSTFVLPGYWKALRVYY